MTNQTFSDYKASKDAQNTIQLNVTKYSLMLCDALTHDFQKNYPNRNQDKRFYLDSSGRKYHKIWDANICPNTQRESRSCHAFIDKKTGSVYKPATYKAPAKHERFNLNIIESREECLEKCDWAGGYLYLR